MTDHWLDDMLPRAASNGREHFQRLVDPPRLIEHENDPGVPLYGPTDTPQMYGPTDMPQRNLPGSHYRNPRGVNMDDGYRPAYGFQCEPWGEEHMEEQFKNGGIQVASGGAAWPLRMELTEISVEDIAHSLSMKVRYTGHCTDQYSIAQHSCHVHDLAPVEDRREALMHDANEYVLPDVSAPVKGDPDFRAFFKPIEHQAERAIAKRFDLRCPWPPSVKYADNQMAWLEKSKIMLPPKYPWMVWTIPVVEPAHIPNFKVWSWRKAKFEFLKRATALGIR